MKQPLPEHILIKLRQVNDLAVTDKSQDPEFQELSPIEAFEMVCQWELGDTDWAHTILNWMDDCGLAATRR